MKKNLIILVTIVTAILSMFIGCTDPAYNEKTVIKTVYTGWDHTHDLTPDYIESWFEVTTDTIYTIDHNLETVPSRIEIRFKNLLTDNYEVIVSYDRVFETVGYTHGAIFAVSNNNIIINTGVNSLLPHNHINTTTGKPEELNLSSGYYKVIIWK